MLQRRRPVLLLLLRTAACRAASTQNSASPAAPAGAAPTPPSPPLSATRRTLADALTTDGEVDQPLEREGSRDKRRPLQHEHVSRRVVYGKEGFNFVEVLRRSGPAAYLDRLRLSLGVYALAGSVALLYLVYYLTTYTYVLTTDPAPASKSFRSHFPCDMAVIESRLTHVRHTIEVTPNTPAAPPARTSDAADGEAAATFVRPRPAIVERRLHVNAMLHSVLLYLQKTQSTVLVDAQAELAPDRFMSGASTVGQLSRASLGFLRADQRLRDSADGSGDEKASAAPRRWRPWRWWQRGEPRDAGPSASSLSSASSSPASSDAPAAARQIVLVSELRLRDATNGSRKGHLSTYEETIAHVARQKLTERYYAHVLARGMSANAGLRKVYAEELIRNGLLTGEGVTLQQLVPDVQQFADEVFAVVAERFGDDVVLYKHWGATR